ncbi:MAG: hypothetical protein R3B95_11665 [Nitrospirales bacterium]|nr:hypothetical protein [Nitrospirales bacterium]
MAHKYQWDCPYSWLAEKSQEWEIERLKVEFLALAALLDSDTLQDQYQSEMDNDGYFEPIGNSKEGSDDAKDYSNFRGGRR